MERRGESVFTVTFCGYAWVGSRLGDATCVASDLTMECHACMASAGGEVREPRVASA